MNRPAPAALRGFTLVEVMVTLVVIGILAAIGFPAYQTYVTRARVSEGLVFADAARTRVDLPLAQGQSVPKNGEDLLNNTQKQVDMISTINWFHPNAQSIPGSLGYILVNMKLPGHGDKSALALQRMPNGGWICTSAAKVGKTDALDEKYLPSTCQGNGTALASAAASTPANCPPDQDMVTLTTAGKSSSACTAKCAAGQTRDAANPTQCNSPAVAISPVAPVSSAQAAIIPIAPAATAAAAKPTTPAALAPTAAVPVAKPATPPAVAAAPVGTAIRPGAAGQAPLQCHTCDPAVPELCELVTVATTCTYPKNYCMTAVDNHADGSKDVKRYCGDYEEMYREWWLGTSDDDKCRAVDQGVSLDFRCTFACETANCNQNGNVRPPEDALFRDR